MRHLYSALLYIAVHPKRFTIMWGVSPQPPYIYIIYCTYISAVKWLIKINHIQNKICLHSICMYTVYIYYVCINTNTCTYIFKNKNIVYILNIFVNVCVYVYMCVCVCVYIYIYIYIYVRLCLPFPCVSTPLYGPSCFLSLVHSSPSVFDLLLTWCCFPWLCYVFISPEFSLSLGPSTRLCTLM